MVPGRRAKWRPPGEGTPQGRVTVGAVAHGIWIAGSRVELGRTPEGTAEVRVADELGLARATGFVHARDRAAQLLSLRLVGQGRLAECLSDDDAAVAGDAWFRRAGCAAVARAAVAELDEATAAVVRAYGEGVTAGLARHGIPAELRLLRHHPDPWTPADTLLTASLMSWVGLAQTQLELELALVRAVHGGGDRARLRSVFTPHLDALDDELTSLLRDLAHVPDDPPALPAVVPQLLASNAWAVAGDRTASGAPVLAVDPHVDVARLPPLWCELVAHVADGADRGPRIGITVPGLPGLLMGRSGSLAWGLVAGYLDSVDLFLEEVRGGRVRRGEEWIPVSTARDVVRRRGGGRVTVFAHRTDCGLLELPAGCAVVPDGLLLARADATAGAGPARSVQALVRLSGARTVRQAQDAVAGAALSATWVFADSAGSTGLQQSGAAPRRAEAVSGLLPARAWDRAAHWRGLLTPAELVRVTDPPGGLVVSANEARNPPGGPVVVNAAGAPHRGRRITELLDGAGVVDVDVCARVQADVLSLQAVRLLPVLAGPLADTPDTSDTSDTSDTPAGIALRTWGCRYDIGSRGAVVFEVAYRAVLAAVFGAGGPFGADGWDRLTRLTGVVAAFTEPFDDVLASHDPLWWGDAGRDAVLAPVVRAALARFDGAPLPRWGEVNQLTQRHLLLGGRLSRWARVDSPPVPMAGGRATVQQVQHVRGLGHPGVTAPSWRLVTDLATATAWTALPGGASDRPWSRWYRNRVGDWRAHRLTRVDLT